VRRMLPKPDAARKGSAMRWKVHSRQSLYASEWVNLELADVELPDGRHLAHHIVPMPRKSAVAAVVDQDPRGRDRPRPCRAGEALELGRDGAGLDRRALLGSSRAANHCRW
jgi:hypothetical protein